MVRAHCKEGGGGGGHSEGDEGVIVRGRRGHSEGRREVKVKTWIDIF